MGSQIVGEDCPIRTVVETIVLSDTSAIVQSDWTLLVRKLLTHPENLIIKLEQDQRLHKASLTDILTKILMEWKMAKGKKASLNSLIKTFEDMNWKYLADLLRDKYPCTLDLRNQPELTTLRVRQMSQSPTPSPSKKRRDSSSCGSDNNKEVDAEHSVHIGNIKFKDKVSKVSQERTKGDISVYLGYRIDKNNPVQTQDYLQFIDILDQHISNELEGDATRFQIKATKLDYIGRIVITCCNASTVNWVVENTNKILNGKFKVHLHNDCPKHVVRTCFQSTIDIAISSESDFCRTLLHQNPTLSTEKWLVMEITERLSYDKKLSNIKLSIPNDLVSRLKKVNYTPFYLAGRMSKLEVANCKNTTE